MPFIRPFEDNYTSLSPSKTSKSPFLSSLSDNISSQSTLTCGSSQNAAAYGSLSTAKAAAAAAAAAAVASGVSPSLPNPFDCFSAPKTPDSGMVDPPSAHLSSQTPSSYLSQVTAPELASFPSIGSSNSASNSSSFKPFASYPYDLIQYPPFKNHMIGHMALSPPLPKKSRTADGTAKSETGGRASSGKSGRANAKSRPKSKQAAEKKTNANSTATSSDASAAVPLNLSTSVPPAEAMMVDTPPPTVSGNEEIMTSCDVVAANVTANEETSAAFAVVAEVN